MRRLIVLVVSSFLLMVSSVYAQAGAPSSYVVKYYPSGGATALTQTDTFLVTDTQCSQAPPTVPPTPPVNPKVASWDDLAVAARVCQWISGPTSVLQTLPPGNYEATVVAVNAGGPSTESNRSPFQRLNPPAVRTGFKIVKLLSRALAALA